MSQGEAPICSSLTSSLLPVQIIDPPLDSLLADSRQTLVHLEAEAVRSLEVVMETIEEIERLLSAAESELAKLDGKRQSIVEHIENLKSKRELIYGGISETSSLYGEDESESRFVQIS